LRTFAIANQKGGCGKTTVAINLSASIAREGCRVLLVDLDPQGHCALGMAVPDDQIDLSTYDCLMSHIDGNPVELTRITWQITPNLELAPSRANLAMLEPKLGVRDDADLHLRDLLQANSGRFDYCVIDCPPHLGLLMCNALNAADEVVVPVDTGYFSLHGLTRQLATIERVCERNGRSPAVRILPNQYDVRTKLAREVLAELRNRYKGLVYDTIINFNTKLKEGASFGQPITEFAPTSMGARDFQGLAREVIARQPAAEPTAEILKHVERLAADAERLLATTNTLVTSNEASIAASASRSCALVPPADVPEAEPIRRETAGQEFRQVAIRSAAERALQSGVEPRTRGGSHTPVAVGAGAGFTSSGLPAPALPATPTKRTSGEGLSHEEINRRIDAIYGVQQEGEVVIFRSRNAAAGEMHVAGDFNDWMPHTTPMRRMSNGDFEARLKLPKGRYRYRLVVDGRWGHDVNNPLSEINEYGELNSIAEIVR